VINRIHHGGTEDTERKEEEKEERKRRRNWAFSLFFPLLRALRVSVVNSLHDFL
jgi:hypothetical protein